MKLEQRAKGRAGSWLKVGFFFVQACPSQAFRKEKGEKQKKGEPSKMGMEIIPKGRGVEQRGSGEVDPEIAEWEACAKQGDPGDGGSQHLPGDRL